MKFLQIEHRVCPWCGQENAISLAFFKNTVTVVKCGVCGGSLANASRRVSYWISGEPPHISNKKSPLLNEGYKDTPKNSRFWTILGWAMRVTMLPVFLITGKLATKVMTPSMLLWLIGVIIVSWTFVKIDRSNSIWPFVALLTFFMVYVSLGLYLFHPSAMIIQSGFLAVFATGFMVFSSWNRQLNTTR